MSAGSDRGGDASQRPMSAEETRSLHERRAAAEIAAADRLAPGSDVVRPRGALVADVAVVKGLPGPAEASGGAALAGADGEAALKALEALGHTPEAIFFTLSRPAPDVPEDARAQRLRLQIEAVDPGLVVAVDAEAASDVAAAFGLHSLAAGHAVRVLGRRLVAVDGLEGSLGDETSKRRVWEQLKAARAEGPVY